MNSKVGGILSIVSGSIGLIGLIITALSFWIYSQGFFYYDYYNFAYDEFLSFYYGMMVFILVFGVIFCALAITGGIFALKNKLWGLALAGSIASIFIFPLCGIPAVIFIAIGKSEFSPKPPETAVPVN